MRKLLILLAAMLAGCGHLSDGQRLGVAGAVAYLGVSPSSELEQVYYLGVFDPQDQLPPTVYRVRVKGQASALNQTRYASGWLPANAADSLVAMPRFASDGSVGGVDKVPSSSFETGRRLVMFGPDGFREAPKDHRLVIVMGSSPEKFFQGVQQALGTVAAATQGHGSGRVEREVFRELVKLRADRDRFSDFMLDGK